MDAWQVYLDEFRQRGSRAADQRFGRDQLLAEAAHDAYQAAADRMTNEHGWSDEHTLVVMRGLNDAVRSWMKSGSTDWDALGEALQQREHELRDGFGGAASGRPTPRA
jgi:hypothetical protein